MGVLDVGGLVETRTGVSRRVVSLMRTNCDIFVPLCTSSSRCNRGGVAYGIPGTGVSIVHRTLIL